MTMPTLARSRALTLARTRVLTHARTCVLTHARICALTIVALTATAAAAHAQALSSSLDVGIASGSAFAGTSPSALLLQPSVRWDHPRTSLDAQASWLAGPDSRIDGDASVRG